MAKHSPSIYLAVLVPFSCEELQLFVCLVIIKPFFFIICNVLIDCEDYRVAFRVKIILITLLILEDSYQMFCIFFTANIAHIH